MDSEIGGIEKAATTVAAEAENVMIMCRICHFGNNIIIPLGCDCKGDLGSCHPHCADVWFSQYKGDIVCEICGKRAKNMIHNNAKEETSIFMLEWNEMREMAASLEGSGERGQRCKQCFFHWLLACFILLFMLLWFFRGIKLL